MSRVPRDLRRASLIMTSATAEHPFSCHICKSPGCNIEPCPEWGNGAMRIIMKLISIIMDIIIIIIKRKYKLLLLIIITIIVIITCLGCAVHACGARFCAPSSHARSAQWSRGRSGSSLLREMGGAPGNPAPRNHLWVWIVKPSGCH